MITGFNTDIEHDGVIYHVQTEDKGLDSPIILSLVYAGGTILASKRSPYEDLIAEGFSDEVLAERLKRQHRLICAAIHSGRINDLKKMSGRRKEQVAQKEVVSEPQDEIVLETLDEVEGAAPAAPGDEQFEIEYWPMTQEWTPPPPAPPEEEAATKVEAEEAEISAPVEEGLEQEVTGEVLEDGLVVTLLDDDEFYSGERYTLRVLIANRISGDEKPLANATISVKILGTTFRPLIYSVKTESDGVATLSTEIPQFTSGRAAVLVRAVTKDQAAELRRIIHPAP
ncbi:MAG TPA: hypothetical protein VJ875_10845 [Pyrinomonadaceae bacterium]|nr:hypothetical protein [Pyrinomonadaceae bacterium]